MRGYRFTEYRPAPIGKADFDGLLKLFTELLNYTAGDADEALAWLNELDKQYRITDDSYGIGDFIQELKDRGYLRDDPASGRLPLAAKREQAIRQSALEEIFGKLRKSGQGNHNSNHSGLGEEKNADRREYQYGDSLDQIDMTSSIHNAQVNHGLGNFMLTERDLEVEERDYKTLTSTVLLIDISHSMITYGEDRITPAKKVAMALAEL